MSNAFYHTPVLLEEVLSTLITAVDGTYIDGTVGGGGHAEAILNRLAPSGKLIGIDTDVDALKTSAQRLARFGSQVVLKKNNFKNFREVLSQIGIHEVAGILLDLGVSSFQVNEPLKGFSFQGNARLDMRMDSDQKFNAYEVVNSYDERTLADVLWNYGEERNSRKIARAIVTGRARSKIETTGQLADAIEKTVGGRFLKKTLARVFQAIRIEVNNELENLRAALLDSIPLLQRGGRIAVVTYHSLEDRIVKETFKTAAASVIRSGHAMIPDTPLQPRLSLVTKKPIVASEEEIQRNPRARSAKLRVAEKI